MLALALCLIPQLQRPAPLFQRNAQAKPPDVVIFVIDDVADSDVDVIATPNLDALAAAGMRFRRAYSHAKCAPTRDSFNYSRWLGLDRGDACGPPGPWTHGTQDFSLAEMFDGHGYNTLHVGKWHVGSNRIGDWKMTAHLAGYDSVRNQVPVGTTCNLSGADQPRVDDGVYSVVRGDNTIFCRDAFLDWWSTTPAPRFAVVNFGSAHAPFERPDSSILPPGTPNPINPTNRQEFAWEVMGVDHVLGEMLTVIPSGAYVFFLGDNGTPGIVPGQSPAVTVATRPDQDPTRVKLSCYEDGVRVPLIVRGPGIPWGRESQALVHVVDLMPTLAQIIGLRPGICVQGRSFGPALLGLAGRRDPVFVWNPPPNLDRAMIGRRWKLLTRSDGVEELYDLQTDPREQFPLPPTGPEADALRAARDALLAQGP